MKKTIEDKQQLAAAMAELPTEYANKLSAWWCRAQKPGKVYVISYDDVEDLAKQIDAHTEKAWHSRAEDETEAVRSREMFGSHQRTCRRV